VNFDKVSNDLENIYKEIKKREIKERIIEERLDQIEKFLKENDFEYSGFSEKNLNDQNIKE
jgi:hypothetical protein